MIEAEAGLPAAKAKRHEGNDFSADRSAILAPGATLSLTPPVTGEYYLAPIGIRAKYLPGEAASLRVGTNQLSQAYAFSYPQLNAPWPTLEAGFLPKPYRLSAGQPISLAYEGKQDLDLDAIVAQPSVEYRIFEVGRKRVALIKNLASERRMAQLPGLQTPISLEPYQSRLLNLP